MIPTVFRSSSTDVQEVPAGFQITQSFTVIHPKRENAMELARALRQYAESLDAKFNGKTS